VTIAEEKSGGWCEFDASIGRHLQSMELTLSRVVSG
jgi:hypothetical protein